MRLIGVAVFSLNWVVPGGSVCFAATPDMTVHLVAEAVVAPAPTPAPVSGTARFQAHDLILGQSLTLRTEPILDQAQRPAAGFIVTFTLRLPDGRTEEYSVATDVQGTAAVTLPAALLSRLGGYQVTTSGAGLDEYQESFMVLPAPKGGISVGPNPFSPKSALYNRVKFVPEGGDASDAKLQIFRLDGSRVFTRDFAAGEEIYWNGRGMNDQIAPAGIYVWQLSAAGKRCNGTVVVIR